MKFLSSFFVKPVSKSAVLKKNQNIFHWKIKYNFSYQIGKLENCVPPLYIIYLKGFSCFIKFHIFQYNRYRTETNPQKSFEFIFFSLYLWVKLLKASVQKLCCCLYEAHVLCQINDINNSGRYQSKLISAIIWCEHKKWIWRTDYLYLYWREFDIFLIRQRILRLYW